MLAMIAEVQPAATDAEFEAALVRGREVRDSEPTTRPEVRSGPNRHGHPHWLFIGEANGENGSHVLGVSVTRVGDKAVLMMFEGQFHLASQAGRAQEAQAFREEARDLLGSVK